MGCNGQSLKSVLDQTQTFLNNHPTETAILVFSHIRNYGADHKETETKEKINNLLNSYSTKIYANSNKDINLAKVAMSAVRGKMILVFDYDNYVDPAKGRFRYKDGASAQSGANITVYDKYSDTSNYNDMKTDQLDKWNQYAKLGADYFFLLSWTLTSGSNPLKGDLPIKTLAEEANSKLPSVLYEHIIIAHAKKPNIIYIDFLNSNVAQSIISYNF